MLLLTLMCLLMYSLTSVLAAGSVVLVSLLLSIEDMPPDDP